jgi:hypothetical protein
MAGDAAEVWRHCFNSWPAEVDRRGVLVTSFDEQIPFESFLASTDMLLVERRAPDTLGARMVLIAFHDIRALKIVYVLKPKAFHSLGFSLPPGRK